MAHKEEPLLLLLHWGDMWTASVRGRKDFVYASSGNQPVSEADLRTHFIREAKNLISLRKNNTIGYRAKWLHSLLIEKMQTKQTVRAGAY